MSTKPTPSSEPAPPHIGAWLGAEHVVALDANAGTYALRATRCSHCGQSVFPGSSICPFCLADGCATLPLHGEATLYSHSCLHTGPKRWAIPYAIGYADFEHGVRLFAKLSGPAARDGEPWRVDQRVALVVQRAAAQGEAPERFSYHFEQV